MLEKRHLPHVLEEILVCDDVFEGQKSRGLRFKPSFLLLLLLNGQGWVMAGIRSAAFLPPMHSNDVMKHGAPSKDAKLKW